MPGHLFIDTDRLELRTPEEEDKEFLREGHNHPDVRRHVDQFRTPTTAAEYDDLYEQYEADEDSASLLVVPKEGEHAGEAVGSAQLAPVVDSRGWANLGAWLHPTAWGNGYATEACAHLLAYGFADLRLHRVAAYVDAGNDASRALVERLGFVHEGTSRDDIYRDGGYVDRERYGLLDSEWAGVDAVLE
ncbi:GNAT family N-acetyltransferase [Halorarius halobius]|uniref:GNAT family N-acetyltransferase n=1 Tax=Halorarius halobius TaxID=2962671 RepID=UPI0020CE37DB|nr:GNAT family protein [Halorarius halobius]